jgi:chromosome segregation ATPase
MNARTGVIILLAVVCAGLGIALFATKKGATEQKAADTDRIFTFSNQVVTTRSNLEDERQTTVRLTEDLSNRNETIVMLTNQLASTAMTLQEREAALKAAQEEMARDAARIAELESKNQDLDKRASDLSTTITNLSLAIEDIERKLANAEGDKAFLEKELERLVAEKAEYERQLNDLAFLRQQVRTLREELAVSKRLEWIRKGLFGEMKGGERMMTLNNTRPAQETPRPAHYNLNVEVTEDGSVRVIPPLTNPPAANNP